MINKAVKPRNPVPELKPPKRLWPYGTRISEILILGEFYLTQLMKNKALGYVTPNDYTRRFYLHNNRVGRRYDRYYL